MTNAVDTDRELEKLQETLGEMRARAATADGALSGVEASLAAAKQALGTDDEVTDQKSEELQVTLGKMRARAATADGALSGVEASLAAAKQALGTVNGSGTVGRVEYYQSRYGEYLNQDRFYGRLRSAVAWTPATITVALIVFMVDKVDLDKKLFSTSIDIGDALSGLVGVIFVCIFLINLALQRQQIIHRKMAQICDLAVLSVKEGTAKNDVEDIESYKEIREKAESEVGFWTKRKTIGPLLRIVREMASITLLIFLLVLGAAAVISIQTFVPKQDRAQIQSLTIEQTESVTIGQTENVTMPKPEPATQSTVGDQNMSATNPAGDTSK